MMELDVLAFAAHPDDIEIGAGGTLIKLVRNGYRVGVVDMTMGEFGSRGNRDIRKKEKEEATRILGIHVRENLELPDGNLQNTREVHIKVVTMIRKYRPWIVLTHHPAHPHPDHRATGESVTDAVYLSGLARFPVDLPRWRPRFILYHQLPFRLRPTFVVDITDVWEEKIKAMMAYRSQFHPEKNEPPTALSAPDFMHRVETKFRYYGQLIHRPYGEGFIMEDVIPVWDLMELVPPEFRKTRPAEPHLLFPHM